MQNNRFARSRGNVPGLAILVAAFAFLTTASPVAGEQPNMQDQCYAPTRELTPELKNSFVAELRMLAALAERNHGVPAPIFAAMAINESGYGTTRLAIGANNVLSYKWQGKTGPDGRGIYTLACQDPNDKINTYVKFRDRADSADFTASRLETSGYYRDATAAFKQAMAEGKDRKAAAIAWFRRIAPTYNPYHTERYVTEVLKFADDPLNTGTPAETGSLWSLRAAARDITVAQAATPQVPAATTPAVPGVAPSKDHVAMVVQAQKSAYVLAKATNGCPSPEQSVLDWPAASLQDCQYSGGKNKDGLVLTGRVVLLKVAPEPIAAWIETECREQLPDAKGCFEAVLVCGKLNSGMMFPVSGNLMEDMDGPWTNWFFRNGMTVRLANQPNDWPDQIDPGRQKELIFAATDKIERIPTGRTRFWRTEPAQFAAKFPNAGAPLTLKSPEDRQKWLDLAKAEFSAALTSPNNRLLAAWVAAHPKALRSAAALSVKLRDPSNKGKKKELALSDCPADNAP